MYIIYYRLFVYISTHIGSQRFTPWPRFWSELCFAIWTHIKIIFACNLSIFSPYKKTSTWCHHKSSGPWFSSNLFSVLLPCQTMSNHLGVIRKNGQLLRGISFCVPQKWSPQLTIASMPRPGKNDRFGLVVLLSLVEDIPTFERNMSFCEIWFSKQLEWWALELRMLQDSIHPWFQLSCVWLLSRELSELSMFYSAKARLVHPQHDGLARIFGPGKSRWAMYPLEQNHGINMRYFRFTACYGMYMPVWQLYECNHIYILYTSCIQYTVYRMYE